MADVHRLGDVWRAEVDDDRIGIGDGGDPEAFVAAGGRDRSGEGLVAHPDIDESGPDGITGRGESFRIARRLCQAAGDLDGEVARFLSRLLRQPHRHRAGIVAELGVGRLPDLLEERGNLRSVDRHDPIGGEAVERCREAVPQPVSERPGRGGCGGGVSVAHHHVAAPRDGRGTRRASLQRCSRSQ